MEGGFYAWHDATAYYKLSNFTDQVDNKKRIMRQNDGLHLSVPFQFCPNMTIINHCDAAATVDHVKLLTLDSHTVNGW